MPDLRTNYEKRSETIQKSLLQANRMFINVIFISNPSSFLAYAQNTLKFLYTYSFIKRHMYIFVIKFRLVLIIVFYL